MVENYFITKESEVETTPEGIEEQEIEQVTNQEVKKLGRDLKESKATKKGIMSREEMKVACRVIPERI